MNYVFVYGTLLNDERNHYLLKDSEYIGSGYIKNYYMFNLSTYPGIQKGNGKVFRCNYNCISGYKCLLLTKEYCKSYN